MTSSYRSKNFDHLGIVSQICDDIGLVEAIDVGLDDVAFWYSDTIGLPF